MTMTTTRSFVILTTLATLALFHCGTSISSDPVADHKVISDLEGTWEASSPEGLVTVTLCEDLVRANATIPNACGTAHVVRSTSTERENIEGAEGGCGGCNGTPAAFFRAAVVDWNGARAEMAVTVGLALKDYDFPYSVEGYGDSGEMDGKVTATDRFSLSYLSVRTVDDAGAFDGGGEADGRITADASGDSDALASNEDSSTGNAAPKVERSLIFTRRSAGGCR